MARRAAGPSGPVHPGQDHAPQGRTGGEHAAAHRREDGAEGLARLRESLLHDRPGQGDRTEPVGPPLRVEDPVHPPPGAGAGADLAWPEVDPDSPAAGESTLMHPDDLAALHALPTTGTETDPWEAPWADPQRHDPQQDGPWGGREQHRRPAAVADGLSLWEDRWDDAGGAPEPDGHGRRAAAGAPSAAVPLVERRWVQLAACALVCLVVGAAAALLVTAGQVDAARADADRQREVATSARADLERERAARAAERASSAPAPAPLPAVPSPDPGSAEDPAPLDPSPTLPTDVERPPVAEAPAPTADPGPPPPGPSPSAGSAQDGASAASSSASSSDRSAAQGSEAPSPQEQGSGTQGPAVQDDDAPSADPPCQAPPEGSPAAGGDGPATCP